MKQLVRGSCPTASTHWAHVPDVQRRSSIGSRHQAGLQCLTGIQARAALSTFSSPSAQPWSVACLRQCPSCRAGLKASRVLSPRRGRRLSQRGVLIDVGLTNSWQLHSPGTTQGDYGLADPRIPCALPRECIGNLARRGVNFSPCVLPVNEHWLAVSRRQVAVARNLALGARCRSGLPELLT